MAPDLYLTAHSLCFIPLTATLWDVACTAVVILLLIASAFISGSETAFFSLTPDHIKNLERLGSRKSNNALNLLRTPDKLFATLSVATSFINIAIVILATHVFYSLTGIASEWGLFLFLLAVSFALLVLGEAIPGMRASQNALKVSLRMAYTLTVLQKIFCPLVVMFASSSGHVRKCVQKNRGISIDDLSNALEKNRDAIPENGNILKRIVKFGDSDVHTIMTPRMDVESVDIRTGLTGLLALVNESGYSRIPVYDDTPDTVKGILYVKDLLPYIRETDEFQWQKLIRDAYFVPEHKKSDDLLKEFQKMKMHMAVIIDEYGGMVGIVTLEDILEEIVGDITDESDDDEPDYRKIDEKTYLFDGKVLLNDFYRIMHLDDTFFEDIRGEADTLAGIFLELKGEIPPKGDCVNHKNLTLCVESVDYRRIQQIKVVVNE